MVSPASSRAARTGRAAVHHVGGGEDVAAGLGLHKRLTAQDRDRLVVEHVAVADQPVLAVAGVGVERDVAQMPRSGGGVLHLLHRPARSGCRGLEPPRCLAPSLAAHGSPGRRRSPGCRAQEPRRHLGPPYNERRQTPGIDATGCLRPSS